MDCSSVDPLGAADALGVLAWVVVLGDLADDPCRYAVVAGELDGSVGVVGGEDDEEADAQVEVRSRSSRGTRPRR